MMDDNCKLILPVDPLDFLMNCDATLQPLPTCRVRVLVPDELGGVNELDKARNGGSLAMFFFLLSVMQKSGGDNLQCKFHQELL